MKWDTQACAEKLCSSQVFETLWSFEWTCLCSLSNCRIGNIIYAFDSCYSFVCFFSSGYAVFPFSCTLSENTTGIRMYHFKIQLPQQQILCTIFCFLGSSLRYLFISHVYILSASEELHKLCVFFFTWLKSATAFRMSCAFGIVFISFLFSV